MKCQFVALIAVTAFIAISFSLSWARAQSSPLQEFAITITSYETEKVVPGSTFKVRFTVHKPAGIRVTDGMLAVYAYYLIDNKTVGVFHPGFDGSSKAFSLPTLDKRDSDQELSVKILDNAPINQRIYIDVWWYIAGVNVSVNEKENRVTVVSGEDTLAAPIVHISVEPKFTRYYIVKGFANYSVVRSDRPDRLYVVGRVGDVEILAKPHDMFLIVVAIASVALLGAVTGIALYLKKKGRYVSEEEVLMGPSPE